LKQRWGIETVSGNPVLEVVRHVRTPATNLLATSTLYSSLVKVGVDGARFEK